MQVVLSLVWESWESWVGDGPDGRGGGILTGGGTCASEQPIVLIVKVTGRTCTPEDDHTMAPSTPLDGLTGGLIDPALKTSQVGT